CRPRHAARRGAARRPRGGGPRRRDVGGLLRRRFLLLMAALRALGSRRHAGLASPPWARARTAADARPAAEPLLGALRGAPAGQLPTAAGRSHRAAGSDHAATRRGLALGFRL